MCVYVVFFFVCFFSSKSIYIHFLAPCCYVISRVFLKQYVDGKNYHFFPHFFSENCFCDSVRNLNYMKFYVGHIAKTKEKEEEEWYCFNTDSESTRISMSTP